MTYCKPGATTFPDSSGCQRCDDRRLAALVKETGDLTDGFGGMIVCATCGNKRCPKATFHGHKCTGSNSPNQPGSNYQYCKCEWSDTDDRWEGLPSNINPDCTVEGHTL